MDWIKAIANDLLNGFSADDIPVFMARLFFSGFIAILFKLIFKKKYKAVETTILNHIVALSIVVTMVAPVAQFSISLGLIMAALIISFIVAIKVKDYKELIFSLVVLLLASSIGAGYVAYTLMGSVLVMIYILLSKD